MEILDVDMKHIDNDFFFFFGLFVEYRKSKKDIQCSNFIIIASHVFGKIHFRNLMCYSQIRLSFLFWPVSLRF